MRSKAGVETAARNSCGNICFIAQSFSNPLEWSVSAGTKCGSVEQEFYGYEGSGGTVGVAKLKIINKAC
jgi:hypothetical protein